MDPGFNKPCPPNWNCDARRRAAGGRQQDYESGPSADYSSNGQPPMGRNQYQTQYQTGGGQPDNQIVPSNPGSCPVGQGGCPYDPTNCYNRNNQARGYAGEQNYQGQQQMVGPQGMPQGGAPGGPEDAGHINIFEVCFMGLCI